MIAQISRLVALILLIDRIPLPVPPVRRGRAQTSTDRLFLKALVIMFVRRWPKVGRVLAEPTREMQPLRAPGGVWPRKHRGAGEVPHTSIDTEAHGTKGVPFGPGPAGSRTGSCI